MYERGHAKDGRENVVYLEATNYLSIMKVQVADTVEGLTRSPKSSSLKYYWQ